MGKPKKAANGKQKVEGMKMKGKSTPTSSSKSSVAAGTSRRSSSQIGKTKEEGKSTPTSSSKSSVSVVAGTSRRSSSRIQTPEPPRFKALQESNQSNGKGIKSYQPFKNPNVLKLTIQRPNKKKEEGKKEKEKMATRTAVAEPQPSPEPVVDLVEQMQALEEEEEEYLSSPSSAHSEEEVDLFRSDMLQVNYKSHPKLIEHMVKSSLMSPAFSDILLCAENEIFHCHKLILAAASEHLARLMERMTTVGPQQVIMMVGMKAQVLKKILEFIYKGSVLVAQENLGDFIKAGTDLKIQGLYCKDVTPSTSKTSVEGGGRKAEEGMWFGGRSADLGFIPPPLAPHCVTTQMDDVLFPVPPNDSRTNTASSDNSDDDEDDDDFKPPRKKRATFGSSGNKDSVLKSPESSINSPQQQGTATPKPEAGKKLKKKVKKEERVTEGLVKASKNKSKEKGHEDIINTRAEDIINELTGLGGLWTMPTFLGTTAIPKAPSAPVASTSGTSKAAKKRPETATSDSNSFEEPVAPAPPPPGAKRPKRVDAAVSTRLSTEEKEKNEEKMQAAIKMAMDTHNVVKSATTHGVATSTLRGRLKKLGYSTPARPPTKITAELGVVATKKAET